MCVEKDTILFTLVYRGETYMVQTHRNQYHTLMTLIADQLAIIGFGLCCGMGGCGTCMVEIRERHSSYTRDVLSCAVQVNDELSNTIITVAVL